MEMYQGPGRTNRARARTKANHTFISLCDRATGALIYRGTFSRLFWQGCLHFCGDWDSMGEETERGPNGETVWPAGRHMWGLSGADKGRLGPRSKNSSPPGRRRQPDMVMATAMDRVRSLWGAISRWRHHPNISSPLIEGHPGSAQLLPQAP